MTLRVGWDAGRLRAVAYCAAMKRELAISVAGRETEVVVEPEPQGGDGRWRIVIDGQERLVDARLVRPGTWSILVDGRSYVIDLDPRRSGTAVTVGLTEAVAQVEDARRRRLARAAPRGGVASRGEELRAPIAGKVVKLLCAEGDEVAAGQGVIVLEAMKMENELVAERGGKVEKIHKQAGQPVDTGDLLVTLV
jgi:biotin carboxyl carrier protein